MGSWVFWAGLAVLGLLIYYAVAKHHIRAMARLETREIELAGWVKLVMMKVPNAWQCPHCGMPVLTLEGVRAHLDAETSACAYLQDRIAAAQLLDAEGDAARPPEVSVSTNARPDSWPALGGDQGAEEAGE